MLVAKLADGSEARAEKDLAEGETATVTLDLATAKPPAATVAEMQPTAAPESSGSRDRTLALIGFGVAGAGLAVGTVTGILAISKLSAAKDSCVDKTCYPDARSNLDASHTMGTISTIAFVVAGVGATVGVIGLVVGGDKHGEPAVSLGVGPGSLSMSGTF